MYYIVIAIAVLIDRITKYMIQTGVELNHTIPIVDGIFHITYIRNYGAAFSILQNKQTFLLVVTGIAILGMFFYLVLGHKRNLHPMACTALALIVGGGIGNLIDRITLGYVVDFFDFRVFPIFNVADICVCCGCGLLIFYVLVWEAKMEKKNDVKKQANTIEKEEARE